MEPVSLWLCSCEGLPHFWSRSWWSYLLLSDRGCLSSCCVAGCVVGRLTGSQWGWGQEMMQIEITSATQLSTGRVWSGDPRGYPENWWCRSTWWFAAQLSETSLHRDIMEPRKLNVAWTLNYNFDDDMRGYCSSCKTSKFSQWSTVWMKVASFGVSLVLLVRV